MSAPTVCKIAFNPVAQAFEARVRFGRLFWAEYVTVFVDAPLSTGVAELRDEVVRKAIGVAYDSAPPH